MSPLLQHRLVWNELLGVLAAEEISPGEAQPAPRACRGVLGPVSSLEGHRQLADVRAVPKLLQFVPKEILGSSACSHTPPLWFLQESTLMLRCSPSTAQRA